MKLKRSQLNKLIIETVVHNKNYDSALLNILLAESSVLDMAKVSEKKYAIVKHKVEDHDYVMIISKPSKDKPPEVVSAAEGKQEGGWWRLMYLHSKSMRSTPLALAGALGLFKKVLVDLSVSKNADDLIKNYYESSKDDESLIIPDADEVRIKKNMDENFPWRRAGYLAPPGSEQIAYRATWTGDEIVDELSEKSGKSESEIRDMFVKSSDEGFKALYADEERTRIQNVPEEIKKKLQNAISQEDVRTIALTLYKAATEEDETKKRPWPSKWVSENIDPLMDMLQSAIKKPSNRSTIEYLDKLIESIFAKEGTPGISVLDQLESA